MYTETEHVAANEHRAILAALDPLLLEQSNEVRGASMSEVHFAGDPQAALESEV
jgi:hypothetical protein